MSNIGVRKALSKGLIMNAVYCGRGRKQTRKFVRKHSVLISCLYGTSLVILYAAALEARWSMWQVLEPHGLFLWQKVEFSRLLLPITRTGVEMLNE